MLFKKMKKNNKKKKDKKKYNTAAIEGSTKYGCKHDFHDFFFHFETQ